MRKRERSQFKAYAGLRHMRLDGFEDEPALTSLSVEGSVPGGKEVSFGWLAGTVLTGVTSILLMGAALYVSFAGVDSFSTAYKAFDLVPSGAPKGAWAAEGKTDRRRPVLTTRSTRNEFEASVLAEVGGTNLIRNSTFIRVSATLATSETNLTNDVAAYQPQNYLDAVEGEVDSAPAVSLDVMGEPVDAEVAVANSALPIGFVPSKYIDDAAAASFAAIGSFEPPTQYALGYASALGSEDDLSPSQGVAENVTVLPKNSMSGYEQRISERIVKLDAATYLGDILPKHGFNSAGVASVMATVRNVAPVTTLAPQSRLRILLGPSRTGTGLIPYRLSIYRHDDLTNSDVHVATVALSDAGQYVLAMAPSEIPFAEESTESISVANLPSIYKAIWETGRRNELDDSIISRIIALVAYDVDLTRKVQPGDALELLQTAAVDATPAQLLYVNLKLGSSARTFYRFRTDEGAVAYFDESGESGKRFLLRRPLEGGGRLTSAMGSRIDPLSGGNANHEGTDFAAPAGTPIFAAADGTVEMAQWYSGYGRYVRLSHANGYSTAYAHMNKIADGIDPGDIVRQGQVIGYVGSTGRSTGNHLHYELEINGRVADPLEVKLPRSRTLPSQYENKLRQTIEQVRSIMATSTVDQEPSA